MQDLSKNIYDHGPARSNGQPSISLTFFYFFVDLFDVFANHPLDCYMFVCSSPNVIAFEMYIYIFSHFLAGGEQKTFTSAGQAAKLGKLTHLVTVATLVGCANLTISL